MVHLLHEALPYPSKAKRINVPIPRVALNQLCSALLMLFPSLLVLSPQGVVWVHPLLRASSDHCASIFSLEGGLDGLPLRVSNEGLLRPRVARAQEII